MEEASSPPVTQLLQAWSAGDEEALARLMPVVYAELRRIAHRRMSLEKPGNSLEPTALVNEVYLRLVDTSGVSFRDRSQFSALAAQMMRRILVDAARARGTSKRGGAVAKISFEEGFFATPAKDREIVALDDALQALSQERPGGHGIYGQVVGEDRRRLITMSSSGNPYPAYSPTGHIIYVDGSADLGMIMALPFSLATCNRAAKPSQSPSTLRRRRCRERARWSIAIHHRAGCNWRGWIGPVIPFGSRRALPAKQPGVIAGWPQAGGGG